MADDLSGFVPSYILSRPEATSSSCTSCSQVSKMHFSEVTLCKSSSDDAISTDQIDPNFESRDTLQYLVQSFVSCRDGFRSNGKACRSPCKNISRGNDEVTFQQQFSSVSMMHSFMDFKNDYRAPFHSPEVKSPASANNVEETGAVNKKRRITWTQDLHNRFIECVDRLGGAKKATPKGIHRLMNCDGLTIFHIKSHLQKYRNTKGVTESVEEEACTTSRSELDPEMGVQIFDALRLQLEVQRRLHEQLENQRLLQMRIEKQAEELRQMLERQMESKTQSQ